MKHALQLLGRLKSDESGATIIEYSLLIGLITVLVVSLVILMGTWVQTQWQNLVTAVNAG